MIFDKTDILSIEFQTQGNENYGYGSQPDVSVFLLDDRNAMKFEEDAVGYWNCKRNGISYEEYSAYQYTHKISFDSIPDYVKNLLFVVTIHVGDCLRKIHKIDVLFNVENNKSKNCSRNYTFPMSGFEHLYLFDIRREKNTWTLNNIEKTENGQLFHVCEKFRKDFME